LPEKESIFSVQKPVSGLRVWSLKEIMRVFDAWGLSMLLHHIDDNRAFARKMCELDARDDVLTKEQLEPIRGIIGLANYHATHASLRSTMDRVWENGPFAMAVAIQVGMTWDRVVNELTVLRQTIEADLEKHLFVFVSPDKAKVLHDMPEKWKEIWKKFPESMTDAQSAAQCYALEQDTGCVFHLMRVAEHGLRAVARKVGVKLTDKGKRQPIEFATWDKVIAGINGEITKARAMPHGPRKNRKLQFYSNAAENCTYIRDLWRNETAHTRKRYNDAEALGVMNRVRDFMQLLVTGI
jgi:hypothetical protein